MKIKELLCDRQSFVKSRTTLEDNAYVLMHYENGAVNQRRVYGWSQNQDRRL